MYVCYGIAIAMAMAWRGVLTTCKMKKKTQMKITKRITASTALLGIPEGESNVLIRGLDMDTGGDCNLTWLVVAHFGSFGCVIVIDVQYSTVQ